MSNRGGSFFSGKRGQTTIKSREATNGNYSLGTPQLCDQISLALGRTAVRGKAGRQKADPDSKKGQHDLM